MTRTIKFRAWDGKKMYEVYLSGLWPAAAGRCHPISDLPFYENSETKIMQFTGLHDKNGKEIWEGDVIRWKDESFNQQIVYKNGSPAAKVAGRFIFACINFHPSWSEFEVLGNIYENGDLIK